MTRSYLPKNVELVGLSISLTDFYTHHLPITGSARSRARTPDAAHQAANRATTPTAGQPDRTGYSDPSTFAYLGEASADVTSLQG